HTSGEGAVGRTLEPPRLVVLPHLLFELFLDVAGRGDLRRRACDEEGGEPWQEQRGGACPPGPRTSRRLRHPVAPPVRMRPADSSVSFQGRFPLCPKQASVSWRRAALMDPATRLTRCRPSLGSRIGQFLLTWGPPLAIGLLIGSVFARSARPTHDARSHAESTKLPP